MAGNEEEARIRQSAEYRETMAKHEAAEAARMAAPVTRPNGTMQITAGMWLAGSGIVLAAVGAFQPDLIQPSPIDRSLYDATAQLNPWKWPLLWGGSGLMSLGVLVWSLGIIVRSLFFLPGRAVEQREIVS